MANKDGDDARPQNKPAAFRLDWATPTEPAMDSQRQPMLEKNLLMAQAEMPIVAARQRLVSAERHS